MRIEYDPEVPAIYITLSERPPAFGEDVAPGVIAHYDASNQLVGLELLDVSLPDLDQRLREIAIPNPAPTAAAI